MKPVISHGIPVTALSIGDAVIGSDTREYMVVAVEECEDPHYTEVFMEANKFGWDEAPNALKLTCNDEDGNEVVTVVPPNAVVDAVLQRAQSMDVAIDRTFGMKRCDECKQMRSNAREWDENDYICKVCRHLLDSGHAEPS